MFERFESASIGSRINSLAFLASSVPAFHTWKTGALRKVRFGGFWAFSLKPLTKAVLMSFCLKRRLLSDAVEYMASRPSSKLI